MSQLSIFTVLLAFISLASADVPSFCKCTCFTNSTIIPLSKSGSSSSSSSSSPALSLRDLFARAPQGGGSCSQCNRAFCLSYNLPICKNAGEKDVFTTCFQRDSTKDQIIVLLFIAATLGLLGWATVKWVMEKRTMRAARTIGTGLPYEPVDENER